MVNNSPPSSHSKSQSNGDWMNGDKHSATLINHPEKESKLADTPDHPASFDGPTVNDGPTTLKLFNTQQLAKSPLLPSLYEVIIESFAHQNADTVNAFQGRYRFQYDHQMLDELGNSPDTFTYILHYPNTDQVIATASAKRYLGNDIVWEQADDKTRKKYTWKRVGPIPEKTVAWELSTMAVDVTLQRQGLASFMMRTVEDEVKRRFKVLAGRDGGPEGLMMVLTTRKGKNDVFYEKRGYGRDYTTSYEKGHYGSNRDFDIVNMSKLVSLEDL